MAAIGFGKGLWEKKIKLPDKAFQLFSVQLTFFDKADDRMVLGMLSSAPVVEFPSRIHC